MKKSAFVLLAFLTVALAAPAVYAQGGGPAAAGGTNWVAISASFGMALAAFGCALAQSRVAGNSVEGMARNPGAAEAIRGAMILGLVFIETLVLFTLVIIALKAK